MLFTISRTQIYAFRLLILSNKQSEILFLIR